MKNQLQVTLLCTSDVHGFYLPWDYASDEYSHSGSLARISTVVNKIREENPHTVLIDNGDLIQGNSAEFFLKKEKYPGIEAINFMDYEIYNMGNHEFNFGMDHLINVVQQFKGVAMMGNLYRKKNTMRFMNGIYYKNIGDVRIAFISLNTHLVRRFEAKRGNLDNYDVINSDVELEKLLNELEDVNAIVGIFHMGDFNENDNPYTGVSDLLRDVPGADRIDAVFGGHMHEFKNITIDNTIFLEPSSNGRGLSRLDLFFENDKLVDIKSHVIKIDETIDVDRKLVQALDPYHNELRNYLNEHVGFLNEKLYDEDYIRGIPQVWVGQTKIANFFSEVMTYYSGADVVALHFDSPYPGMKNKSVKRKDVYDSYRYSGGEISKYKLSGYELKKYMEWSASFYNQLKESDVHISFKESRTNNKYSTFDIFGNLNYKIDISKVDGSRIIDLRRLDGTEIKDDDEIVIGMNKYRMDFLKSDKGPLKGRKIKHFWTSINNPEINTKGNIRSLAIDYFNKFDDKTYIVKDNKNWKILKHPNQDPLVYKAHDLINLGRLPLFKNEFGEIDLNRSMNLDDELELYQLEKLSEFYDLKGKTILRDILNSI